MKTTHLIFLSLLISAISIPSYALDEWFKWGHRNGVVMRHNNAPEWRGSSAIRTEGELSGEIGIVWSEARTEYRDIYLQVIRPDGTFKFGEGGVRVTDRPWSQQRPAIAPCEDGGWFVGWVDMRANDMYSGSIYCTRISSQGEVLWHNEDNGTFVIDNMNIYCNIAIYPDQNGGCFIGWQAFDEQSVFLKYISSEGQTNENWGENGRYFFEFQLDQNLNWFAANEESNLVTVQTLYNLPPFDFALKVHCYDSNGDDVWQEPTYFGNRSLLNNGPKLCPDGQGGYFIIWKKASTDDRIISLQAQRIDQDGNLMWDTNGHEIGIARGMIWPYLGLVDYEIQLVSLGVAAVIWTDRPGAGGEQNDTTYVRTMLITGDEELEKLWEPDDGVILSDGPGTNLLDLSIAAGPNNSVYFSWLGTPEDYHFNPILNIQRIEVDGTVAWENNLDVVTYETSLYDRQHNIHSLSNGDLLASVFRRDSTFGLATARISPDAEFVLDERFRFIAEGYPGEKYIQSLLSPADNEFAVVWKEKHNEPNYNSFIQRGQNEGENVNFYYDQLGLPVIRRDDDFQKISQFHSASDGSGNILATWRNGFREENPGLFAQCINSEGERLWGDSPVQVSAEPDNLRIGGIYPKICPDRQGGAFIAWNSDPIEVEGIKYLQHLDSDGNRNWDEDKVIAENMGSKIISSLKINSEDQVFIMWLNRYNNLDYDIRLAGYNFDGSIVEGFQSDSGGICVSQNEGSLLQAEMVLFDLGILVWWLDRSDELDSKLTCQLINYNGQKVWNENGVMVVQPDRYVSEIKVAGIDLNNIWFSCISSENDDRNSASQLSVQKLIINENLHYSFQFDIRGKLICNVIPDNFTFRSTLNSDMHGGAWITWTEGLENWHADIKALHLRPDGEPYDGWDEDGEYVCDAWGYQADHWAALLNPDGEDGIVCVWLDLRTTDSRGGDIFCQRIDDDAEWVSVDEKVPVVSKFELNTLYPNPFNSTLNINYQLDHNAPVTIMIYDTNGRLMDDLSHGTQSIGHHKVIWDASKVPSGVYMVRLGTENQTSTRKVVLMK